MKSVWKWVIAGAVILTAGLIILISTLAVNGWSIKAKFTMETFTASGDNTYLEIDIGASSLKTEFYDGEKIEISYPAGRSLKTDITEKQGKLTFASKVKWFAQLFNTPKVPETVIKLPKDKIIDLEIDLGAGTISLGSGVYGNILIDVGAGTIEAKNLECRTLDCDISAGAANLKGVTCSALICDVSAGRLDVSSLTCPDIKADVSAGRISLGINGTKSEYGIRASVSAGSCNVSNQTGTTSKMLVVDCSAGSVNVSFSG